MIKAYTAYLKYINGKWSLMIIDNQSCNIETVTRDYRDLFEPLYYLLERIEPLSICTLGTNSERLKEIIENNIYPKHVRNKIVKYKKDKNIVLKLY